jgi:hypothetical protein
MKADTPVHRPYTDNASIFADIKDLVGARIILAWRSENDFKMVKKLITQTFDVLDTKQHPMSRSNPVGSTSGFPVYTALHFAVRSRDPESSMSRPPELRFEIQVMSTFMYFYDSLYHQTYEKLHSEAEDISFDYDRLGHGTRSPSLWEPSDAESRSLEEIFGLMRMSEMIVDKIRHLLVNTPNIRAMVDEEKLMLKKTLQVRKSWEDDFWGFTPRRQEPHNYSLQTLDMEESHSR